jgi:phenylacetate-coenzyme A ligase PaaK-like adenylate-forming protein
MLRLIRGKVVSKLRHRALLPRDLWPVKALICWGIDTNVHRQALRRYWGAEPFEFLATTEGGIMAMQAWNKKGMTFLPGANFLEFIPDDELARERRSPNLDPATHLMDELLPGHSYEVVITSLNGMPFVRYRTGELVEVVAAADPETGVMLPQFSFVGRADRIIDIEGFTRLDETTLDRAISAVTGGAIEWTARKELEGEEPILRVYAEGVEDVTAFEAAVHESLVREDAYYRDLQSMLEVQPLRVTPVERGTFRRFYDNRRVAGYAVDVRSMPRVNPTDDELDELLDPAPDVRGSVEAAA